MLSLLAALLGGLGVLTWLRLQDQSVDRAARQALEAARGHAVTLTTYDHRSFDADVEAALASTTGEFRASYARATDSLRELIVTGRATASGTVVDAAVKAASTERVEVLVFVDQRISNRALADEPRVDRMPMRLVLLRRHGAWLVGEMELG